MCFIIRIEEQAGLFKGYYRIEDIKEANRLYNHLIEYPFRQDTVVKLFDDRLNILKSSLDLQPRGKRS